MVTVLLGVDVLEKIVQGHVCFELDFEGTIVVSNIYNIIYNLWTVCAVKCRKSLSFRYDLIYTIYIYQFYFQFI